VGTGANRHWRNNLMLGQNTAPAIFSVTTSTAYSTSDYNGFRLNPDAPYNFQWNVQQDVAAGRGAAPDSAAAAGRGRAGGAAPAGRGEPPAAGRGDAAGGRGAAGAAAGRGAAGGGALQPYQYRTLAEYQKGAGQDRNSVLVDYEVFVNVPKLDRDVKTIQRLYNFRDYDFRLRPGSAAIDRAVAIPNVNDGFTGKAPDLGALEQGQPLPTYGPRP
jgi:hypothetical protein